MIITMLQEDKSLQNSVNIYSIIHTKNQKRIEEITKKFEEQQKKSKKKKVGRPRKSLGRIAKSKQKDISRNTSAYTQARNRLPQEIARTVFEESKDFSKVKYPGKWKGMRVFIADGTYLQVQDTAEIKKKFKKPERNGYPRALLEVIIEQGSGCVYDFQFSPDSKSELELLASMLKNLPAGSLLIADALYDCFAIFSLLKSLNIDIIVSGKKNRKHRVIKGYAECDQLIEIKKKINSKWMRGKKTEHTKLLLRRIEYANPQSGKKEIIHTSLIDKRLSKSDIILKYRSRWDIEVSIKEIKMLMDLNVLRSKKEEMMNKELISGLIAYNYIRKTIAESVDSYAFPPETDIIEEYYKTNKPILLDKLGRRYNRWSPGRGGYQNENTKT